MYATAERTLKEVKVRSAIDHLHICHCNPSPFFFLLRLHIIIVSLVVSPSLLTPSKLCLLAVP
jgi:hypothetical protein